jgi:phosphatidylserine/phosphatidylglycerophosphate/cardiolipin synthase-like enzyme
LRALAAALREGAPITRFTLQQLAGTQATELKTCLDQLQHQGFSPAQSALLVEAIIKARENTPTPASLFELVLSGPDVPGIPTGDTAALIHTLIEEATTEIMLVSYAIHNGQRLFERLAAKVAAVPALRVVFILDISRKQTDTSLTSEIVQRFAHEFREKQWPWRPLPELFYDPRSLSEQREKRSSLHAKCVIVDRRVALVTSANFTEAAQQRNIEAGVVVRYAPFVERLSGYFEGLIANEQLLVCEA